jgi:cell division protein FtsW
MTARLKQRAKQNNLDYPLLITVMALSLFGVIAIWATSIPDALRLEGNPGPLHFVIAQLKWLAVGTAAAAIAYKLGYRFITRISFFLLLAALALLLYVQFKGEDVNGAQRWLSRASIQPGEFAKPIIVIYLAYWLSSKGEKLRSRDTGLIPFTILVALCVVLIVLQPDFSTAVLLALVALVMFLMAGARVKEVGLLLGGGTVLAGVLILVSPYRWSRLLDYFSGGGNEAGSQKKFLEMLADSAGIFGHGLDKIQAAATSVTGAHMDFIFAFITYGFGVVAALVLVAAFLFLGYRCARIARRAPDALGMLISLGLGSLIMLQALVHMAVNAGMIPVTGLTLPFISYGGSSLVTCLASVGVLLSVSQDESQEKSESAVYLYRGRDRRPRLSEPRRRTGAARKRARR